MKLVKSTDPILKTKMEPVPEDEIIHLLPDSLKMHALMEGEEALGLASPQVGLTHRMFVMLSEHRTVINPEIIEQSEDEKLYDEGCLSFPLLWMKVKRPTWVEVKYKTFDSDENDSPIVKEVNEKLYGVDCQCFCHELDHLNGVTFDERVGSFTYKNAKRKQLKLLKKLNKNINTHKLSGIAK